MPTADLLVSTDRGLYCAAGDFFIDPWEPVPRAVITHAHADHAVAGCGQYLCARDGATLLALRIGLDAALQPLDFGEPAAIGTTRVSLHPAGHVLGSAQIRVATADETWVVSGDYKLAPDPTCASFETVPCDVFVSESTFGLPVFRWPDQAAVFAEIERWWRENAAQRRASVVYAYALGKAQRLLAGLDTSIGPVYCHGAIERVNAVYRTAGVQLAEVTPTAEMPKRHDYAGALIVAPPSARGSVWLSRFGDYSAAFASGWMQIRGVRRRRVVDRGFVLSDHADWPGLVGAIRATGARRVLVTHGSVAPMVRWLNEQGWSAAPLATPFLGELDEGGDGAAEGEEVAS